MQLDNEDRRSYEQREFFRRHESNGVDGFTIFIAVLAAILAAGLIFHLYTSWQIRRAEELALKQLEAIALQAQAQMQQAVARQKAMQDAAKERARLQNEQTRLQMEQARKDKEAAQAQQIAAIQRDIAKQKAWEEFYKPIAGCESSNPNKETIKCGNDYLKAKKKFEEEWSYLTSFSREPHRITTTQTPTKAAQ